MSPRLRLTLIVAGSAVLLAVIWWRNGFWTFLVLALMGLATSGFGLFVALRKRKSPPND